jgi:hypothetical protein
MSSASLFAPGLIPLGVPSERHWADTKVPRNERNRRYRRHLLRAQHFSWIALLAKQQSKAEPAVVAAFPKNDDKVLTAQCPVPDDFAFVANCDEF